MRGESGRAVARGSGDAPAPFEWVREIATGGMGSVELVLRREGTFRRLYAVKRLLPHLRADADLRAMFLDEARVAGLLRHPNVVSVLDIGEDASGPFLVMDYVEGISLGDVLKRAKGTMPVAIGLRIVAQAAEGLHAAHELVSHDGESLGLIHRDVSPHNFLIGFDGRVRVTDFGVAKAIGQTTATAEGVLKGKLGYMSPEQLRFKTLDRRSDLFSLGVVLYEVLAGARLYLGDEGLRRLLEDPPPDVGEVRPEVPPAIVELCMQLLAKKPAQRPMTARNVAERIDETLRRLAVEEGDALSLETYMRATFADVAGERREVDNQAMSQVDERHESAGSAERRPRGSRFAVLALVIAFAIGVGGALVYTFAPPFAVDGGNSDLATSVEEPTSTHAPPSTEEGEAPVREPDTSGDEATATSVTGAESDSDETAAQPEPTRRSSMATRRSRARMAAPAAAATAAPEMSGGGQIPQWGWSSDRVAR